MSSCVEYFSEGYESITEDISFVEPDINNSTATGECESNSGCYSSGINLIAKKKTKMFVAILSSR